VAVPGPTAVKMLPSIVPAPVLDHSTSEGG